MNQQIFAELYAGQFVKVARYGEAYNGTKGRVVGYRNNMGNDDNNIFIEVEGLGTDSGWNKNDILYKVVNDIKYNCYLFPFSVLEPLIQPKAGPDDCDDCGAVGEEKCKESCPNANN